MMILLLLCAAVAHGSLRSQTRTFICPVFGSCTAGDVTTSSAAATALGVCSGPSSTVSVSITVQFAATSKSKYDVGIVVSNNGQPIIAGGSNCDGYSPSTSYGPGFSNLETGTADTCGDISQNVATNFTFVGIVKCTLLGTAPNTYLSIPSCRTWNQQKDSTPVCTGVGQLGTGSKCDCSNLSIPTVLDPCLSLICPPLQCQDASCARGANNTASCFYTPSASGTTCGNGTSNTCTSPDTCNASGVCQSNNAADGTDCSNILTPGTCQLAKCASGSCGLANATAGTACGNGTSNTCTAPDTCNGSGVCQSNNAANGTSCGTPGTCQVSQCTSGSCVLSNATSGSSCGNSTSNTCTSPDTCNGSGVCQANNAADGTECSNLLTPGTCQLAKCTSGSCGLSNATASTACGNNTSNTCTAPDTCNGSGVCQSNNAADGTECSNILTPGTCQLAKCTSGSCGLSNATAGTACGNSTSNTCTAPDTCDGSGGCQANNAADGTNCSNILTPNQCQLAQCTSGACQLNNQPTGTSCTVLGKCTDESCNGGNCVSTADNAKCTNGCSCATGACSLGNGATGNPSNALSDGCEYKIAQLVLNSVTLSLACPN